MAVWNIGSINLDNTYRVTHLPQPGETLAAWDRKTGLGGKGANMSVALARAGTHVSHIGAVGPDGRWARDLLTEYGVDTREILEVETETAHANITLADDGENQIILHPGANHVIPMDHVELALAKAKPGDVFVTQNETNSVPEAVKLARAMGLPIFYAAAPFVVNDVLAVLEDVDTLILNEGEAAALEKALNSKIETISGPHDVIVTRGANGVTHIDLESGEITQREAYKTQVVDTTGAGDTFTGYFIAGRDRGMPAAQAIDLAQRAASLMVARVGTADVIPDLKEIQDAFS